MFSSGKKPQTLSNQTTLVAAGTTVCGNITFAGNVEIEGRVEGDIESIDTEHGVVTVLADGVVEGRIRAPDVIINGKVEGDVISDSHVALAARAMVTGNVFYHLIEMVKGAQVNGKLLYHGDSDSKVQSLQKGEEPEQSDTG